MRIEVETPSDFSFVETLNAHGWRRLAPFDCDDSKATIKRAERLPSGDVAILEMCEGVGSIRVSISGTDSCAEIEARVRTMFQLDLPIGGFHDYCLANSRLAHIPQNKQGRMLCSPSVWEDCCKVILTTNTTWAQTVSMTKRFVDTFGSSATKDSERKAFPTPEQVAAVNIGDFEAAARFGYRNMSIHALANSIVSKEIDLEALRDPHIAAADLRKRLLQLRGIGPYAASCLMIYLGRYEQVNVDSWARMMVSREVGRPVSDKEVHEFFAPHGKWCGLVYHFYPWKEVEPVY